MLTPEHIRKVAQGDVEAFHAIYDALAPRLLYYVFRVTRERPASEDIVHEAFVLLWENRRRMADVIDIKAWLFTVAYNLLRNHTRVETVHRRVLDRMDATAELMPENHEQQLIITAEICGEIRGGIARLPGQTRTVIELSMQGMSVAEVAERMGISPNTVKSLKKSGYRLLRERLGHLRIVLAALLLW